VNQSTRIEGIFEGRDDYLIIKMSDIFPFYTVPSDVDVLCLDKWRFADGIRGKRKQVGSHLQVDITRGGKLDFKFDLIDNLKEYGLDHKEVFKNRVLEPRRGRDYWVPRPSDEIKIRTVEYRKHRHKTWHKEYIDKHAPGLLSNLESRIKI
jgi:hypothetical protein